MASDQLRKKWGTIFMGEREATPQQLDAMQEPLLRERAQHQQQEDYLARVRARAEERAREILGAAYAERQKVLEEAGTEAKARIEQLTRAAQGMKAQMEAELAEAQAERDKARELREEAEFIRSNAHNEGFQAGMEQAGEELKEFRIDVGQMLANLLRALEAQRHGLGEAWREELAELARVAVEAGTGWILQAEHQRILQSLVFSSLQLLEDRATVTIRVHPDDEDTVSDLFRAARERVPELSQWIVNGDASVEAGGLVAESVSGSVENLREHYREMVNGILEYLTLPPRPEEEQTGEEVSAAAQRESARLAQVVPEAAPVEEALPSAEPEEILPQDQLAQDQLAQDQLPENTPDVLSAQGQDYLSEADSDHADPSSDQASLAGQGGESMSDASSPEGVPAPDGVGAADDMPEAASAQPDVAAVDDHMAETLPALAEQSDAGPDDLPEYDAHEQPESAHAANADSDAGTEVGAEVGADEGAAHNDNPSLAELEDELFPLPEEEKDHDPESSSSVFVSGGFLPGSDNGQPG